MVGPTHRDRRRRSGHQRSRNGCLTCKIRRVKCDEKLPSCRRCTETGRKCEGPALPHSRFVQETSPSSTSRSASPVSVEMSLFLPKHSPSERRAFHYLTHQDSTFLSGTIDAKFWEELAPRLAQTYDFVWDIVVCTSLLAQHVSYAAVPAIYSASTSKAINQHHREALRLYNRAILSVRKLTAKGQEDDAIIALSYLLFASVEFHHRNVKLGQDLLQKAGRLMSRRLKYSSVDDSGTGLHLIGEIAPFVLRKAATIATLGYIPPASWLEQDNLGWLKSIAPTAYMTIAEAKTQFHKLIHQCFELIRVADFAHNVDDDDPTKTYYTSLRPLLLDKLKQWKMAFSSTCRDVLGEKAAWLYCYYLTYWHVCNISLATCLSPYQIIIDEHFCAFAEILYCATIYLEQKPDFVDADLLPNFEADLMGPLYFTAIKCREPLLRRQALSLMQEPCRDNDWAFGDAVQVAKRFIAIEEDGLDAAGFLEALTGSRYRLPTERQRFAYVSITARASANGRLHRALELTRFEVAKDGSRRVVTEHAWLNE